MRRIAAGLGRALLVLACCGGAPASAFDRAAWQAEFAQLERELAAAYANLDWAIEARRMDLVALSARTREALGSAASEDEARRAFERFLAEFGDGHLRIVWPRPQPAAPSAGTAEAAKPAARSCADLGFRRPADSGLDFAGTPRFRKLDLAESASFPTGVLETPRGRRVGIVRIALLMEGAFPEICERVHPVAAPCDEACESRVYAEVGRRLGAALATQLRALAAQRVDAIAIDLTSNGGGSDWAEAAARIVTAPGVAAPRMAFIRHPHWAKQLGDRLRDVETDLARKDLAPPLRAALEEARSRLAEAARVAGEPCDRSAAWEGRKTCDLVAERPLLYSTGVFAVRPALDLAGLESDHALFRLAPYAVPEGAWRGRLAVLVDGGTASAAELFAATLQDNRRATIIGSPTFGSGCGYTNGGIPIRLSRSGATLRLPDCVRLRADGSNEVEGVTPDVLVGWRSGLSRHQRAQRVLPALERWVDKARK